MSSAPMLPCRRFATTCLPSSAVASVRSAYGRKARPASESFIPRPVRTKSSTPRPPSSDLRRAVIAGWVRKSASAARLTFPRRATSTKLSRCAKSMGSWGISVCFIALIRTNDLPDRPPGTESAISQRHAYGGGERHDRARRAHREREGTVQASAEADGVRVSGQLVPGGARVMTTEVAPTPLRAASSIKLVPTPLLPEGYTVPASRFEDPSTRMRRLLDTAPFVFGPGVYDPHGAELCMYYGFKSVYFSGYSFAIGHLGTTDMDLYTGPEIADGARRTVTALRKFQLTMALGDPEKGVAPKHLEIPPVVVDMDGGYGNLFIVQRTTDLFVNAGVAAAHIEDQVLPKRCGHIAGKALISADEMVGKLSMMRAVADDLGRDDFVVIARTDAVSAVDAPEKTRGLDLAIERALRYLDSGAPDLVWCEFPNSDREPTERFADQVL